MNRLLGVVAALVAALGIVLLLTDQLTLNSAGRELTIDTIAIPIWVLLGLGILAAALNFRSIQLELDGFAKGEVSARARRRGSWALFGLVVFGALLRFEHIQDYFFNPDEAIFVSTSTEPTYADVWIRSLANVHPPTNYLMLHTLLKVSWDPTWVRMGSLLAGIYLIWISYKIGEEAFGIGAGLVLACVIALSPNFVLLSRVVRNYSMALAFMATAYYFFVRYFLNTRSMKDLLLFALFETLSAGWLYALIVLYLGLTLALFVDLLARRAPLREWVKTGLAQLPVGLLFLAAFTLHIPRMEPRYFEEVGSYYGREFNVPIHQFLVPWMMVYYYLFGSWLGFVAFAGAFASLVALAMQRKHRVLILTLSPIPFAVLFHLTERIPIGNLRHSAYLFPPLMLLFAYQLPLLLDGYREPVAVWSRIRAKLNRVALHPRLMEPRKPSTLGALLLMSFVLLFAERALRDIGAAPGPRNEIVRGIDKVTNIENPVRRVDIEEVWRTLRAVCGPEDIVVASYQPFLLLRLYVRPEPTLKYDPYSPASFSSNGVRVFYSPDIFWSYSVKRLLTGIVDIREREGLVEVRKIWVPSAGYQLYALPLSARIMNETPYIMIENPTPENPLPLVLGLDARAIAQVDLKKVNEEGLYHDEGLWNFLLKDRALVK